MISIRRYLDAPAGAAEPKPAPPVNRRAAGDLLSLLLDAYRSTLSEMGRCSTDACHATGPALERDLLQAADALSGAADADRLAATRATVRNTLKEWGHSTARHYQQKAGEVKSMLLAMAQTAASVGQRDQRCAEQLHAVTAQLSQIASLDDVTVMRNSIVKSAAQLKSSIDRMTEEGTAVLAELQSKVTAFQARLEEAEEAAACDALTRLRSRLCTEGQLEQRIAAGVPFCIALFDIDGFKQVNDLHGHVVGDELLKQFATELRSACRSSDVVGRWGGDEFLVLLDCDRQQATAQIERVTKWLCGNYAIDGVAGSVKLHVTASVGLAEFTPPETSRELLDRADSAMYEHKMAARASHATA